MMFTVILKNVRRAPDMAHLVVNCEDRTSLSYELSAT
jgi:hypothetical protein